MAFFLPVKLRIFARVCGLLWMLLPSHLYAWGRTGHELVAELAAELSPHGQDFWTANAANLGVLANVPDTVWKSGRNSSQEKPTHWFQIDAYTSDPWTLPSVFDSYTQTLDQYGIDVILENGTAYWRVQQFFQTAVTAFQQQNDHKALQLAGVMAHYIGDLSQPLHVTVDYDGPQGANNGIHSFFESRNIDSIDLNSLRLLVKERAQTLLDDTNFSQQAAWPIAGIVKAEMARSAEYIQEVLERDEIYGRSGRGAQLQLDRAVERLADGVATLALVLGKIVEDSGQSPSGRTLQPMTPAWVRPDYGSISLMKQSFTSSLSGHGEDDCQQSFH